MVSEDEAYRPEQEEAAAESEAETEEKTQESVRATTGNRRRKRTQARRPIKPRRSRAANLEAGPARRAPKRKARRNKKKSKDSKQSPPRKKGRSGSDVNVVGLAAIVPPSGVSAVGLEVMLRWKVSAAHVQAARKFAKDGFRLDVFMPQTVRFSDQNIAGASSQDTYLARLEPFWDFLSLLGRYEEQFMLLENVRDRSPAISPESMIQFMMYKNEQRKKSGDGLLRFNGKVVKDKHGEPVKIVGGWGKKGSWNTFRIFMNAVNNIHAIGNHDFRYQTASESACGYAIGNPTSSPVFVNFVAGEAKMLASVFISQAKEALSPEEFKKLIEVVISLGRRDPGMFMFSVMFRLEVALGLRYNDLQNMTYGSITRQLTRMTLDRSRLRTIGFAINGKTENRGSEYVKGEANITRDWLQLSAHATNSMLCSLEGLLMWLNYMYHHGVDMRDDSHIFMNRDLLEVIAQTDSYGLPILFDPVVPNAHHDEDEDESDASEEHVVDQRVRYSWGIRTLKKVLNTVIPGWTEKDEKGEPRRKFGTHTAKKTGVNLYVIAGQEYMDHTGNTVKIPLREDDFCKVFRFCAETMKKYYMPSLAAWADNIKKESDSWQTICTPFIPGHFDKLPGMVANLDPTIAQAQDTFKPVTTLNGNDLINSLVGLSISLYGEIKTTEAFYQAVMRSTDIEFHVMKFRTVYKELVDHIGTFEEMKWVTDDHRGDREFLAKLGRLARDTSRIGVNIAGRVVGEDMCTLLRSGQSKPPEVALSNSMPTSDTQIGYSRQPTSQTAKEIAAVRKRVEKQSPAFKINSSTCLKQEKKKVKPAMGITATLKQLQYIRDEFEPYSELFGKPLGVPLEGTSAGKDERKWFKQVLRPILRCFEVCSECDLDGFIEKCKKTSHTGKPFGSRKNTKFELFTSAFKKGCPCSDDCASCYHQKKG